MGYARLEQIPRGQVTRGRKSVLRARALKAVRTRRQNAVLEAKFTKEEFNALAKSTQRCLLALDVLKWIRTSKIKPYSGMYLMTDAENHPKYDGEAQANSKAGQACLLGSGCHVCAKGALFMAHVMRADKITVQSVLEYEIGEGNRLVDEYDLFTPEQYTLIERAFEGWGSDKSVTKLFRKVFFRDTDWRLDDGEDDSDPVDVADKNCLAAIMINLLEHGGTFVPRDKVTKEKVDKVLADEAWGARFVNLKAKV